MPIISGPFEVKAFPLDLDETSKSVGIARMRFEKQFSGSLNARSTVAFTGMLNKETGSGAYVALEVVDGSIDGRHGKFHFQHSCTMNRGQQEQSIKVVPDSGTGDLVGITGEMKIEIKEGGSHFYTFEYSLP